MFVFVLHILDMFRSAKLDKKKGKKQYLNIYCTVAISSLQDHYPNHTVLEAAKKMRARG